MGPTYLILAGLVLDIIGAFVLAVEAIGLDRIRSWARASERSLFLSNVAAVCGVIGIGLLAVVMGIFLADERFVAWPIFIASYLAICFGFWAVLNAGEGIAQILFRLEDRTRRGAAGLLGFGLLASGFALQFAGTLWSALRQF